MSPELSLARAFASAHPERVARLADAHDAAELSPVLAAISPAQAGRVLASCTPVRAARALQALDDKHLSAIVAALGARGLAPILLSLPGDERGWLTEALPAAERRTLDRLLHYGPHVAGGVADPRVACVQEGVSVATALEALQDDPPAAHYYVYVIGSGHRLTGVASLRSLLLAPRSATINQVMAREPACVPASAPISTIVSHVGWSRFSALPVVAAGGELVGVIRYAHYRALVEGAKASDSDAEHAAGTVAALSEVYTVGASALVHWVGSSLSRDGGEGD